MKEVVQFPQSDFAEEQTGGSGALSYDQFWLARERPKFVSGSPLPDLYEAQQGPAYYWLMLPIFDVAGGTNDLALSVSVLRLVNVAFGAAALAIVLVWAGRSCRDRRYAMVIGLETTRRTSESPLRRKREGCIPAFFWIYPDWRR